MIASKLPQIRDVSVRYATDCQGTTAIEYAVMVGGIALAILLAIGAVGTATIAKYGSIVTAFRP